ncbi:hypothetical protein LEMLEM_LOCUS5246 [Lemmus lemmus]
MICSPVQRGVWGGRRHHPWLCAQPCERRRLWEVPPLSEPRRNPVDRTSAERTTTMPEPSLEPEEPNRSPGIQPLPGF